MILVRDRAEGGLPGLRCLLCRAPPRRSPSLAAWTRPVNYRLLLLQTTAVHPNTKRARTRARTHPNTAHTPTSTTRAPKSLAWTALGTALPCHWDTRSASSLTSAPTTTGPRFSSKSAAAPLRALKAVYMVADGLGACRQERGQSAAVSVKVSECPEACVEPHTEPSSSSSSSLAEHATHQLPPR